MDFSYIRLLLLLFLLLHYRDDSLYENVATFAGISLTVLFKVHKKVNIVGILTSQSKQLNLH